VSTRPTPDVVTNLRKVMVDLGVPDPDVGVHAIGRYLYGVIEDHGLSVDERTPQERVCEPRLSWLADLLDTAWTRNTGEARP
jgi:hypothetical protein